MQLGEGWRLTNAHLLSVLVKVLQRNRAERLHTWDTGNSLDHLTHHQLCNLTMAICKLERLKIKSFPSLQGWKPQHFWCAAEVWRTPEEALVFIAKLKKIDIHVSGGLQLTGYPKVDALDWRQLTHEGRSFSFSLGLLMVWFCKDAVCSGERQCLLSWSFQEVPPQTHPEAHLLAVSQDGPPHYFRSIFGKGSN